MADEAGGVTYARARPDSAALFLTEGYEVLERIDADLGDYSVEGGKTTFFVMRREDGVKSNSEARMNWSWKRQLDMKPVSL